MSFQPQRIHVLAVGSAGDVLPLAWLAHALAQRGHDVHLLAPEPFAGLAARFGLKFVSVLSEQDYRKVQQHPALWNPTRHFHILWPMFLQAARNGMAWLANEQAAGRPAVLLGHSLAFAARIARDRWQWPQATVHVSPCWLWSRYDPPQLHGLRWVRYLPSAWRNAVRIGAERLLISTSCLPGLNQLRREFGLKPIKRLLGPWMHSPELNLGLFPPWFVAPQADWPAKLQLVGFLNESLPGPKGAQPSLSPELEAFIHAGKPPLVFLRPSLQDPVQQAEEAKRWVHWAIGVGTSFEHPVLLLGLEPALLDSWQSAKLVEASTELKAGSTQVMAAASAPLEAILPHAAALVCHGGIGTIRLGLAAGCPMLLTAVAGDHFDNVARCVALGVARELPPKASIQSAVGQLKLSLEQPASAQQIKTRCQQYQALQAAGQDALTLACEALEELVQRRQSLR